ncbi:MAG: exo-alpha-sialidase [Armatimonadota bacterium]
MSDWRNIKNGHEIPAENYCDQPYVVVADDGAWVCTLTTGTGAEGGQKQHVIAARSTDHGKTWSEPVDIEPAGPPESSWVMPLKLPSGRIYAFYVYNKDNLREVVSDRGTIKRVDTLGYYAFKYSDDHGKSWSDERHYIPIRETDIDRQNPYEGEVRFFWGVGKPIIHDGRVYIGFSKVGGFGEGFMSESEGYFLCSDNILTETDPTAIEWETLPDTDVGLQAPKGPIAEEHNLVGLSDGSLYCTYRTIDGHPCHAYSRNGGHTWTYPQYATYTPSGRRLKHPRAACFVHKFSNGKYILWFHNHGGRGYADRNPAWICGGIEKDGLMYWSEPEILLYDSSPSTRISYPDFIEDDGRYFVTETQKSTARVHEIDPALLEAVWTQHERSTVTRKDLVLELAGEECAPGRKHNMPRLPNLSKERGVSIGLWLRLDGLEPGQVLLDWRDDRNIGGIVRTTGDQSIALYVNDGTTRFTWDTDPGSIAADWWHHVVITMDGGPFITTAVVNGQLCDGGAEREFGWARFEHALSRLHGSGALEIAPEMYGEVAGVRIYDRPLLTSEAVGNYRAGRPGE